MAEAEVEWTVAVTTTVVAEAMHAETAALADFAESTAADVD
jgi:hypothetical protein